MAQLPNWPFEYSKYASQTIEKKVNKQIEFVYAFHIVDSFNTTVITVSGSCEHEFTRFSAYL